MYLAAVMEYLAAEILEYAGKVAIEHKKLRINPSHLLLAIQIDEELNKILSGVTIPQGDIVPGFQLALPLRRAKSRNS